MAQVLRPLCVLALLILTMFTNYQVIAEPTLTRNDLLSIRDTLSKDIVRDIWTSEYRNAVKAVDPTLLKAKKRGKRAGVKSRLQSPNAKIPLPGLLLTNARSVLPKIDELFAMVKDKKMSKLSQMICITESWLSPSIRESQTALDGYAQFRNDRSSELTGKHVGGGILVYVDESWSKNNTVIFEHAENSLEMLTIKCRPSWLPREFQSTIMVTCYCPFTGTAKLKAVVKETENTITQHIQTLENDHPNSVIMISGDFNQQPMKLTNYQQIFTKPTRNNRVLDKCFINVRNAYSYCRQLGTLGGSDHQVVQLLPTYHHKSKQKPVYISKRQYSDKNIENLRDCLEVTDWEALIDNTTPIDDQVDVFNDYINFCTDMHIPAKQHKHYQNNKPWITRDIIDLVRQRHTAHIEGNDKLSNLIKKQIERAIFKSRKDYTNSINAHLVNEPSKAWSNIKKLGGLISSNHKSSAAVINAKPNELNQFFARFEKPEAVTTTPLDIPIDIERIDSYALYMSIENADWKP